MSRFAPWVGMEGMLGHLPVVARTVFGEARGESFEGQVAVAWVIRNRAEHPRWWGKTLSEVCRAPFQFSCWNQDDPNYNVLQGASPADPAYTRALGVTALVLTGDLPDPTGGGTHYHADGVSPSWAGTMTSTGQIGRHTFYKEGGA